MGKKEEIENFDPSTNDRSEEDQTLINFEFLNFVENRPFLPNNTLNTKEVKTNH
jgi:hypothetical protein